MKLILNQSYDLYRKGDKAFCDSLQVAETFERQHKHILTTIDKLNQPTSGLSETFRTENFEVTYYKDSRGRRQKKYLLTKDGFIMVTMEFKTARARQFKEAYIKRFNEMADFINMRCDLREEFPEFTEAVKLAYPEAKHYHYINEINMIYSVVLGQTVQSYKKEKGISGLKLRDNLSTEQLRKVRKLQRADIGLLFSVPSRKERKKLLDRVLSA